MCSAELPPADKPGLTADALLAGPRGRSLCTNLLDDRLTLPGRGVPGAWPDALHYVRMADTVRAARKLSKCVGMADLSGTPLDGSALMAGLQAAVDFAWYWQAHTLVAGALAEGGRLSESMGKLIADYTDKLPAADRDAADAILLGVARAGARQDDIARLAAQMYERSRSGMPGEDPGGHSDPDGHSDSGPSLPLDVGVAESVPAGIRQAILHWSGGHCEWAGGCWQPATACHLHHVTRKADGGKTSVKDCLLLYSSSHHLVAVHRWGWKLILNADGTTMAWSPDGSKVLHSHGPPPRPG